MTIANNDNIRSIYVYAQWKGMNEPHYMGRLKAELLRGKEVYSFTYSESWLQSPYLQHLDPELLLYPGPQFPPATKMNFGLFLDSSPDRWGRILMKRRESIIAQMDERPPKTLRESDYLLGVFDEQRMGALRFKNDPEGPFVNDNQDFSTPPWTSVGDLEKISLRLEDDDVIDDPDYYKWLTMLINPGSSLGGARPKAGISDKNGNLWIAKFPTKNDTFDSGGWEIVTADLARDAGLKIAESMAKRFSDRHHTFLSRRFDRTAKGERVHYASAMTMLGYCDSDNYHGEASYLEIAEFIVKHGAFVDADLKELWCRILFSVCISNTDDHLRNHGFLLTEEGWTLSPAFDINPCIDGAGLSLNITLSSNDLNPDLPIEVAEYFRISKDEAVKTRNRILQSIRKWSRIAEKYKIPKQEQQLMAKVFNRFL